MSHFLKFPVGNSHVDAFLLNCTAIDFPGIKERTLVAVKPDGVQRRLIGEIIKRFEQRGFRLVGLKMLQVSDNNLFSAYVFVMFPRHMEDALLGFIHLFSTPRYWIHVY